MKDSNKNTVSNVLMGFGGGCLAMNFWQAAAIASEPRPHSLPEIGLRMMLPGIVGLASVMAAKNA